MTKREIKADVNKLTDVAQGLREAGLDDKMEIFRQLSLN
jgi:hypothetical protein